MKKLVLTITLALGIIAGPAYANTVSEAKLDSISTQVNNAAAGIKGNCLMVAIEKQRRLLKEGIKSEVVAFMPFDAERKYNKRTGKYEKIGHAVLCVDNKCVDNGELTHYVFDRKEIAFHGDIITAYKGKQLAGR